MTPTVVLPVVIGGLYAAGVYLMLDRSLTRVVLGFLLVSNATSLLVLSAGGPFGRAPIVGSADAEDFSDPLPQALVLTAIVITFGITAFFLAVIHRSWRLGRQERIEADEEDRRVAARTPRHADALDPDDIDPGDLDADGMSPEERAVGHRSVRRRRFLRGRPPAPTETASDDVDLPGARGDRS